MAAVYVLTKETFLLWHSRTFVKSNNQQQQQQLQQQQRLTLMTRSTVKKSPYTRRW
jgi:hypothetical protein